MANISASDFWDTITPLTSGNGSHGQEDFVIEENSELIKDPTEIANIFNEYYTNIVQHATGNPPVQIPITENGNKIDDIMSYYENHSSIIFIKNRQQNQTFELSLAKEEQIREIMQNLDATKATGIDNIPCRLVKLSEKVITKPLTPIISYSISKSEFRNDLK